MALAERLIDSSADTVSWQDQVAHIVLLNATKGNPWQDQEDAILKNAPVGLRLEQVRELDKASEAFASKFEWTKQIGEPATLVLAKTAINAYERSDWKTVVNVVTYVGSTKSWLVARRIVEALVPVPTADVDGTDKTK